MLIGYSTSKVSDEQLMHLVKIGDSKAFEIIYDRYAQRLLHYFQRMLNCTKAQAEDFLQELFLKVIRRCESYDETRSFKTWLFTIAYNMCKNEFRRQAVRKNYLNTIHTKEDCKEMLSEESLDRQYFQERLINGLEQLSEEQRAAFLLRFKEELTIPQISMIMNCPAGTVKSRLFYACDKLAHLLEEFDPKGDT